MGDPKKQRKKYDTPMHPWKADRINEENKLQEDYGLKNKTEIWKMSSKLKRIKAQAKQLISRTGKQAEKEEHLFRKRLEKLGLMSEGAKLENVLDLGIKDILERRLQTHVFKRGLAKSMKQARQFITHGHIMLNNRKITSPACILLAGQEAMIAFRPVSGLADAEHPERKSALKKAEQKPEENGTGETDAAEE